MSNKRIVAIWDMKTLQDRGLPYIPTLKKFMLADDGSIKWEYDQMMSDWWTWNSAKQFVPLSFHYVYEDCLLGYIVPSWGFVDSSVSKLALQQTPAVDPKSLIKCECGGEKAKTTHSNWCQKYVN